MMMACAAQQGGHIRVRAIDHRTYPRMPGALNNDGILAAGDRLKRFKDLVLQLLLFGAQGYIFPYSHGPR